MEKLTGLCMLDAKSRNIKVVLYIIEEVEYPKVRIGEVQLMHDDKELNKNIMFEKNGKDNYKKLGKN